MPTPKSLEMCHNSIWLRGQSESQVRVLEISESVQTEPMRENGKFSMIPAQEKKIWNELEYSNCWMDGPTTILCPQRQETEYSSHQG